MKQKKGNKNITSYLASAGLIFPTSPYELDLFEKGNGLVDNTITGKEVNPFRILERSKSFTYSKDEMEEFSKCAPNKIVIPEHIKKKMAKSTQASEEKNNYSKVWKHKSVVQLMNESGSNPIDEIRSRARQLVLSALESGWSGPPFSAIELAKILGFEISPNDTITDARTKQKEKKGQFLIEYNPFQKPTRMNFSIAHEITHTLFSDCGEMIRNREEQPDANRELEQLCNIGASELQLPYVVFPHDANGLPEITSEALIHLATRYKSSLESTFLAFVSVVNRSCAIIICTFTKPSELTIDYYKGSSTFRPSIPKNFKIPNGSNAYFCTTPGWTSKETVRWEFLDDKYDIHCIGLSPMRQDNRGRVGIIITPNDGREDLQSRKINREFGDATKPQGKGNKLIAQVVNTSASLGAGFGKALSKNYPEVKEALAKWKDRKKDFQLGRTQLVQVKDDTYVLQMLAQKGLFPKYGEIPLQYTCLQQCLADLRKHSLELEADVYMPLIGAGHAKGNWEIIEGLIYAELVNHDIKVTIYLLNQAGKIPIAKSNLSMFNESSSWRKEK